MPDNTVYVGRPSKWGNPARMGVTGTYDDAVEWYKLFVARAPASFALKVKQELAGKNLACWCPLDMPCHADVLLKLANEIEGA
jgi:hypothetical protein